MQSRISRLLLLLLTFAGFGLASCEAPTDVPVDSGRASVGVLASPDLSTYYYPHRAGVVYVYSNKLTTVSGSSTSTVTGNNDTVRTLGFQGFAGNDSVFAVSITYQTLTTFSGHGIQPLRYLPASSSFGGAYIAGNTPLQGETTTYSLATRASSTDSITSPTYGRMRALASDLAGAGSSVWQTDTIYYTSDAQHVAFYSRSGSNFTHSKTLFSASVSVMPGSEWSYSAWQTATEFHVISENQSITVGSTNLNAIHGQIENSALNVGSTSSKYFAPGYGQVRQVETFYTTTDGLNRATHTYVREGVVVIDWDEIATL